MKSIGFFLAASLVWALGGVGTALANVRVVATLPDLAAIAREVGGDRVTVECIGKPNEDPHFIQAKPSYIVTLNRADLLVENGLELEIGWLPALVQQTRNGDIRPGASGDVVAARDVPLLDVPTTPVTRAMGDVHPGGNPHFSLDPERGKIIANNVYAGLVRIDPDGQEAYRENLQRLLGRIDAADAECRRMLQSFRGTKVVTYHKSLTYFLTRYGFEEVDTVETKPGIAPSPAHVADLIAKIQREGIKLILMEPWHEHRTPDAIARQSGAVVLELPAQVGAQPDIPDYPSLCKGIATRIVGALQQ